MKKLFTISIMLIAFISNAQNYNRKWSEKDKSKFAFVSLAFDARHAISGSEQTGNKSSLDVIAQVGANYHGVEVSLEYEDHSELKPKFQRYAVLVGYVFNITDKISVYNGISYGSIIRANNSNFLSFGYNGEIRHDLGDKFILGARLNVQQRKDIEHYCPDCESRKFVGSGFVSVYYKLN